MTQVNTKKQGLKISFGLWFTLFAMAIFAIAGVADQFETTRPIAEFIGSAFVGVIVVAVLAAGEFLGTTAQAMVAACL